MATLIKQDWTLKVLLLVVVALLATNLVVMSGLAAPRQAQAAGIPDSGAVMQAIVDEIKSTNARLDTLQKFLASGSLTVNTKPSDKAEK